MSRLPLVLFAIGSLLLLTSCNTIHETTYQRLVPADTDLPVEGNRILVVDRHWLSFKPVTVISGPESLIGNALSKVITSTIKPLKNLQEKQIEKIRTELKDAAASSFPDILENDLAAIFAQTGKYQITLYPTPSSPPEPEEKMPPRQLPEPLSPSEVERLIRETDTDMVIALESIFVTLSSREEERKTTDINDQEITETSGQVSLQCLLTFRVYDPLSGLWLDLHEETAESVTSWEGLDFSYESTAVANHLTALFDEALRKAIRNYAGSITPHFEEAREIVLTDANSPYKERLEEAAKTFADYGNWEDAIPIWQEILPLETPGPRKGKIYYNLSLAAERQMDFPEAIRLARLALAEHNSSSNRLRLRQAEQYSTARESALYQLEATP